LGDALEVFPQAAILSPGKGFQLEDMVGKNRLLEFLFYGSDRNGGVVFNYGSESEGPSGDICDALIRALEVTESWYQEFRKTAGKTARRR